MAILNDILANVQKLEADLQSGALVRGVVINHEDDILEKQREQLFTGKNGQDEDIRPYYSEDLKPGGYFKSAESARNYAAWKQSLSYPVQAQRNADAPNLYINGQFHSELVVNFGSDTMTITGGSLWSEGIVGKYGLEQFGLSDARWQDLFENYGVLNEINEQIRNILWQ